MEITLKHAKKMRDDCQKYAQFRLEVYRDWDQSDRSKEVMESALDTYSYWIRKVNELEEKSVDNIPAVRMKDRINEDMTRCPSHNDDYWEWYDDQL